MQRLALAFVSIACALPAAPAGADEVVERIAAGAAVVGAGGEFASSDGATNIALFRAGGRLSENTGVSPSGQIDIGLDARRRPTVVWINHAGAVWTLRRGRGGDRVARVPRGARAPALWGTKLAYVRRVRGCDVPFVRDLRSGRTTQLARGSCAQILALDLSARWLVARAEPDSETEYHSDARAWRLPGGRPSVLVEVTAGEERHQVTAVAVEGDEAFILSAGDRPDSLRRHNLRTGSVRRATTVLEAQGAMAVSGGTVVYTVADPPRPDVYTEAPLESAPCPFACPLIESRDPFARTRSLPPTVAPQPVFRDRNVLSGVVARRELIGDGRTRPAPAGRQVELRPTFVDGAVLRAPIAPDGSWSVQLPASDSAGINYTVTVDGETALDGFIDQPRLVRIVVESVERLPDGRVRFQGSLGEALPSRRIAIWRGPTHCTDDIVCAEGRISVGGRRFDFTSAPGFAPGQYFAAIVDDNQRVARPEARSGPITVP